MAENQHGIEQSRLYQINSFEDPSTILVPIILSVFLLIITLSITALYCSCRAKQHRKRSSKSRARSHYPHTFTTHFPFSEETSHRLRRTLLHQ